MAKAKAEYRVVRRKYEDNIYFIIMELWYDEEDKIEGWVDDPHPFGESIRALKADLERFKKALLKEVLDYDDFATTDRIKSKLNNG